MGRQTKGVIASASLFPTLLQHKSPYDEGEENLKSLYYNKVIFVLLPKV